MIPERFAERMRERLGGDFPAFLAAYDAPPYKGLRVNTLKISVGEFARRAPFPLGERVEGADGFYISEDKPGADPYHFAGLYYMQEPSAMAVGAQAGRGMRVLDLCAAPGGKTTQIAAAMGGEGFLLANEIDPARAKTLSGNIERMGVGNCAVSCAPPETLAARFPSFFDLVLVDAPCSGEGMFRKEPAAAAAWSEENVRGCAARQRRILDCAAAMVCEGGRLVYSTCTFAEEEDEAQVEEFLRRFPSFSLLSQRKYYPHEFAGEGHFCAVLCKTEGVAGRTAPYAVRRDAAAERAFRNFSDAFFSVPPQGEPTTLKDGRMYLVPAGTPDLSGLRLLRLGVALGEFDGKIFKPSHALAMALGKDATQKLCLSREEAERYLRGESIPSAGKGWCVVCVEEFPLGLGKGGGGTVKNLLPKGLRKIG